jgi:hypothetical protein
MKARLSASRRSSGRASWIVVVSGAVVFALLVLVVVKFLGDRRRANAEARSAEAAGLAARQVREERAVEASRRAYGRELKFCEALRRYEGADIRCLEDLAAEHGDLFFCDEMPAASRPGCVERVARATGQARLCDQVAVPERQRDCYFRAAASSSDAAACQRLADVPARKACIAIARGDARGCEDVTEASARQGCYRHLAVKTKNPSLCEGVRNHQMPDGFQGPLYECWKETAGATLRLEDCDAIPHEGVHVDTLGWNVYRRCRERVELRRAGVECRDGPVDLTCRGKLAAARSDIKMCENLRSYTDMDLCALTFAFRRDDRSACGRIRDEGLKSACLEIAGAGGAAP